MPQSISGSRVSQWVRRITLPNLKVRGVEGPRDLPGGIDLPGGRSESLDVNFRQSPNSSTSEGRGLLTDQLPHVSRQRGHQIRAQDNPVEITDGQGYLSADHSGGGTVRRVVVEDESSNIYGESATSENSAEDATESSREIGPEKVADRVYHLMQHDLILERERVTRFGG